MLGVMLDARIKLDMHLEITEPHYLIAYYFSTYCTSLRCLMSYSFMYPTPTLCNSFL